MLERLRKIETFVCTAAIAAAAVVFASRIIRTDIYLLV